MTRAASVGARNPPLPPLSAPAGRKKASAATAASVVAGVHSISAKTGHSTPHTTLTPLTPLKRATKSGSKSSNASVGSDDGKQPEPTVRSKRQNGRKASAVSAAVPPKPSIAVAPAAAAPLGSSSIGGAVIGPPLKARTNATVPGLGPANAAPAPSLSALGGQPIVMDTLGPALRSSLGGDLFTGALPNSNNNNSTIIGGNNEKWNSSHIGGATLSSSPMLGSNAGAGLWGGNGGGGGASHGPGGLGIQSSGSGGGVIGSHISNNGDSSSALASILGINLPTGSGSLHETSNIWPPQVQGPSALASLNGSVMPSQNTIGPPPVKSGSSLIGGVPIGGGGPMNGSGQGGKSDIALLQSLLPGVHITTGQESFGFNSGAMGGGWDSAPGRPNNQGLGGAPTPGMGNVPIGGSWNGGMAAPPPGSVGAIGQNNAQQQDRSPGIW